MKQSSYPSGFDRTLINENMQIRSVCIDCRIEIIGSAAHGLAEIEATHRRACNESSDARRASAFTKSAGSTEL